MWFEKNFYFVIYDSLLRKMIFYGIIGAAHKLMESCLRNRHQSLTINAWKNIKWYISVWEIIVTWRTTGVNTWTIIVFNMYNAISKNVSEKRNPILFHDVTSFIIANCDEKKFKFITNKIFNERNIRFCRNFLTLYCDKT